MSNPEPLSPAFTGLCDVVVMTHDGLLFLVVETGLSLAEAKERWAHYQATEPLPRDVFSGKSMYYSIVETEKLTDGAL